MDARCAAIVATTRTTAMPRAATSSHVGTRRRRAVAIALKNRYAARAEAGEAEDGRVGLLHVLDGVAAHEQVAEDEPVVVEAVVQVTAGRDDPCCSRCPACRSDRRDGARRCWRRWCPSTWSSWPRPPHSAWPLLKLSRAANTRAASTSLRCCPAPPPMANDRDTSTPSRRFAIERQSGHAGVDVDALGRGQRAPSCRWAAGA